MGECWGDGEGRHDFVKSQISTFNLMTINLLLQVASGDLVKPDTVTWSGGGGEGGGFDLWYILMGWRLFSDHSINKHR